jgi:hypothetical protein
MDRFISVRSSWFLLQVLCVLRAANAELTLLVHPTSSSLFGVLQARLAFHVFFSQDSRIKFDSLYL